MQAMPNGLDFILPSCPDIPDSMWIAASTMISVLIKRSWVLLGAFLTIRLLADTALDVAHGQFAFGVHLKTCFHALLVVCFLKYSKSLLMFFDSFIDQLCDVERLVVGTALAQPKDRIVPPLYGQNTSWFVSIRNLAKAMLEIFPKLISVLTHTGAIHAMHYLKAVTLLVMSQVGPLAALFSLLPGPFKKGWAVWASSYIHVTCWSITLNLFRILVKAFTSVSLLMEPRSATTFFSETVGHTFLSLVLLIAIFLTPTWTSKFMGHALTANLGSALGIVLSRVGWARGRSIEKTNYKP